MRINSIRNIDRNTNFKGVLPAVRETDALGKVLRDAANVPPKILNTLYELDRLKDFSDAASHLSRAEIIEIANIVDRHAPVVSALLEGRILQYIPGMNLIRKVLDLKKIADSNRMNPTKPLNLHQEIVKSWKVVENCEKMLRKTPNDVDLNSSSIRHSDRWELYTAFIDGNKDVFDAAKILAKKDGAHEVYIYGGKIPKEEKFLAAYRAKQKAAADFARQVEKLSNVPRPKNLVEFMAKADDETKKSVWELSEKPYFNAAAAHMTQEDLAELFKKRAEYKEYFDALLDGEVSAYSPAKREFEKKFPSLKKIAAGPVKFKLNEMMNINYIPALLFDAVDAMKKEYGALCKPESLKAKLSDDGEIIHVIAHFLGEDRFFGYEIPALGRRQMVNALKKQPDKTIKIDMSDFWISKTMNLQNRFSNDWE